MDGLKIKSLDNLDWNRNKSTLSAHPRKILKGSPYARFAACRGKSTPTLPHAHNRKAFKYRQASEVNYGLEE